MRLAAALDADRKNWVQAYAYMVGVSRRGDTLGRLEAAWLEKWLSDGAANREPRDVIVSQVSIAELTGRLFGGQRQTAQRALCKLTELNLIELVEKGKPGHSSLYAMGVIHWDRDTEGQEKVSDDVENHESVNDAWDTENACMGYAVGYSQHHATCGNDAVSNCIHLSGNQEKETRGKSHEGDFLALRCRHCGSAHITRNSFGLYECLECGSVTKFRATA